MKRNVIITVMTLPILLYFVGSNLISFIFAPTLEVKYDADSAKIRTLTLAEYYTPVESLEIYEGNRKVVLFTALKKTSRMHTITVNSGLNAFNDMYLDGYEISYPYESNYKFEKNTYYNVIMRCANLTRQAKFILRPDETWH